MSDAIHQPHDKLFKAVFSDVEETAEFLHLYLPEPLRDLIDWKTLRLVEGTFIDEELTDQENGRSVRHYSGTARTAERTEDHDICPTTIPRR